jgi:ferric-dicitrate binding protein FerR (iron transport regulator)
MHEIAGDRKKTDKNNFTFQAAGRKHVFKWKSYYTAAAIFTGVALCTVIFTLLNNHSSTLIGTQYAQTRNVALPDGSSVILNSNSTLRFSDNWAVTHKREVWLTGEAFFNVRKKPEWANARFIVHTEGLHVEVLGTTFNVNNRRGKVKVVLNTGKVKLEPANNVSDTLTMQPRDLVEFTTANNAFVKKRVDPEEHSSWRNHKLVFNEATLYDIAQVLEDNYGVQVQFEDPGLKSRKFTGAIPNQDLRLFLSVLAQSMDIKMLKNKHTILIKL